MLHKSNSLVNLSAESDGQIIKYDKAVIDKALGGKTLVNVSTKIEYSGFGKTCVGIQGYEQK